MKEKMCFKETRTIGRGHVSRCYRTTSTSTRPFHVVSKGHLEIVRGNNTNCQSQHEESARTKVARKI